MSNENVKIMENEIRRIQKEFVKQVADYRKNIARLEQDAPIEVLCLPKDILTILHRNGISRVFDLTSDDFTKIKGLGDVRINTINVRLNLFLGI